MIVYHWINSDSSVSSNFKCKFNYTLLLQWHNNLFSGTLKICGTFFYILEKPPRGSGSGSGSGYSGSGSGRKYKLGTDVKKILVGVTSFYNWDNKSLLYVQI